MAKGELQLPTISMGRRITWGSLGCKKNSGSPMSTAMEPGFSTNRRRSILAVWPLIS